jgi:hypothetical protein
MFVAQTRIDGKDIFLSQFEAFFYEGEQRLILLIGVIKESADMGSTVKYRATEMNWTGHRCWRFAARSSQNIDRTHYEPLYEQLGTTGEPFSGSGVRLREERTEL